MHPLEAFLGYDRKNFFSHFPLLVEDGTGLAVAHGNEITCGGSLLD